MNMIARRVGATAIGACVLALWSMTTAHATQFSEPWLRKDHALVIDAYEYNEIDWQELATDERIAGFINKASDGMPPAYRCTGDETERRLCSALWKRYSVARELYHTRKTVAKALGLKWGAYHLGRPGNPIEQADHFIEFANPGPDDLVALDIEENDPEKWMSLEDAEIFVARIKARLGRYPILYTNGSTAKYIAQHRADYPLLSRLPLWYARYRPEIADYFPKGNWDSYALWQFSSLSNCNAKSCPYRVPGTPHNIDVNVAAISAEELREAWPFGKLIDHKPFTKEELIAQAQAKEAEKVADAKVASGETVPVPIPRADGLAGAVQVAFVPVEAAKTSTITMAAYAPVKAGTKSDPFGAFFSKAGKKPAKREAAAAEEYTPIGLAEYLALLKDIELGNLPDRSIVTGSQEKKAVESKAEKKTAAGS